MIKKDFSFYSCVVDSVRNFSGEPNWKELCEELAEALEFEIKVAHDGYCYDHSIDECLQRNSALAKYNAAVKEVK